MFLYCAKLHTLSESTSTLDLELEDILIQGVVAHAALNRARSMVDKVNVGGANADSRMQGWGVTQLTLYKDRLNRLPAPRVKKIYPTG